MNIVLKNIGMLKEANINLNGLTIIAGENDTGKSTVGKILFCIVKAISRYEEDFKESKEYKINEILERLFFSIRRSYNFDKEKLSKLNYILSLDNYIKFNDKNNYAYQIKKELNQYMNKHTDIGFMEKLEELESIVIKPENKQKSIENALNKVFRSEFNSNILYFNKALGSIKLYENDLLLLDIEIDVNNKISLKNTVKPIEFNEATFIETPLILNNSDLLIRSQTGLHITKGSSRRLGIPNTTLHTKDLFDKLKLYSIDYYFDDEFENKIKDNISNIINGEIIFDEEEKDFVYLKDEQKIPIKNTATGVKSFGIIQLLINNEFINRTSLLILDEPEIHLHPKWQIKYAELIVILAKNDIPILITSHSPYMIEALKRYSDKYDLESKTSFQLSVNNIIEKENKLSDIFKVLSEPFETFRQMDAQDLKNV
jgi:predicted ATPase